MKYEAKIEKIDGMRPEFSSANLLFVGKDGEERNLYLGHIKSGSLAERCLSKLYDFHQCNDDFGPEDEIVVAGVGTFKVVGTIHIVPADEATKFAVIGVTAEHPYRVAYDGIDGNTSTQFATLAEADEYVKGRWNGIDYVDSNDMFHNDYGKFVLFGFSLKDLGKVTGKGPLTEFTFMSDCPHAASINAVCIKCGKKLFQE